MPLLLAAGTPRRSGLLSVPRRAGTAHPLSLVLPQGRPPRRSEYPCRQGCQLRTTERSRCDSVAQPDSRQPVDPAQSVLVATSEPVDGSGRGKPPARGPTLAAQSGAALRELMALGGHSTPRATLIYQQAGRDWAAEVAGTMSTRLARMRPRPMGTTGGTAEGTSDLAGTRRARKPKNGHHQDDERSSVDHWSIAPAPATTPDPPPRGARAALRTPNPAPHPS